MKLIKKIAKKSKLLRSVYYKLKNLKSSNIINENTKKFNETIKEIEYKLFFKKPYMQKKMNRIALDSFSFIEESLNRGIGRYTQDLLSQILQDDKSNEYFIFVFDNNINLKKIFKNSKLHIINIPCINANDVRLNNNLYGLIINKLIKFYGIDEFLITNPYNGKIFSYKKEWYGKARISCILYDAIPYIFKDYYLNNEFKEKYLSITQSIKSCCNHFFAISNSTKIDYVNFFKFDDYNIEVIYSGLPKTLKNLNINTQNRTILNKYGIINNFYLFVSGDDFRKNNESTIKAYSKLPKNIIDNYQLVIVCKLREFKERELKTLSKNLGLEKRIIITNYVNTSVLSTLYSMCSFVIFPSLYEGFGLPVIEGFFYKKPVLTSNNSSLGEISSNAALHVNPFSVNDISKGLEKITKINCSSLIKEGTNKLNYFNWNFTASILINYFKTIYRNNSDNKIAIFTPLPPVESGISDYSFELINKLSKKYYIDIFVDDNYLPINFQSPKIKIYNHRDYKQKNYKDTIFEFGNNVVHKYMIPYIILSDSIVELHDSVLKGLSNNIYYSMKLNRYSFANKLRNIDFLTPLFCNLNCDFILHSNYAKKVVLKHCNNQILVIPLYSSKPINISKQKARRKLGISLNEISFASFGVVHESKRSFQELYAFKKFTKKYPNLNAKYYFIGPCNEPTRFNTLINKLHLTDKVIMTNFIDLKTFYLYLRSMDLNFNLRFPYKGENSSVLVRALNYGLPSVVYPIGSFDEYPSNCVCKIKYYHSNKKEIREIYRCMNEFIIDKKKFKVISINAKCFAKKFLDIGKIADSIDYFVENRHFLKTIKSL